MSTSPLPRSAPPQVSDQALADAVAHWPAYLGEEATTWIRNCEASGRRFTGSQAALQCWKDERTP